VLAEVLPEAFSSSRLLRSSRAPVDLYAGHRADQPHQAAGAIGL